MAAWHLGAYQRAFTHRSAPVNLRKNLKQATEAFAKLFDGAPGRQTGRDSLRKPAKRNRLFFSILLKSTTREPHYDNVSTDSDR